MKEIFVDIKHCIACKSCELVCAVAHSQSQNIFSAIYEDPQPVPHIRVKFTKMAKAAPMQCHHCKKPPCVQSCTRGAIKKDTETDLTLIDNKICLDCSTFECANACPFGAIIIEKDKKIVLVCDQCVEIGEPVCIKACPTKVFSLKGRIK